MGIACPPILLLTTRGSNPDLSISTGVGGYWPQAVFGVGIEAGLIVELSMAARQHLPVGGGGGGALTGLAVELDQLALTTALWSLLVRQFFFITGHANSFARMHVRAQQLHAGSCTHWHTTAGNNSRSCSRSKLRLSVAATAEIQLNALNPCSGSPNRSPRHSLALTPRRLT